LARLVRKQRAGKQEIGTYSAWHDNGRRENDPFATPLQGRKPFKPQKAFRPQGRRNRGGKSDLKLG
jgi:hypothetical protein